MDCALFVFKCALDALFSQAAAAVDTAANSALTGVANGIGSALAWLVGQVAEFVSASNPHLTMSGFLETYTSGPERISFALSALFLIIGITHAQLSGRHERMAHTVVRYIVALSVVTFLPFLGMLLLEVGDELSAQLTTSTSEDLSRTMAGMVQAALDFNVIPVVVSILLAMAGVLAALVLMIVFLLRDGAIYLIMFFSPLAMAAWVWGYTGKWMRRMGEMLVALILVKPVIAGSLSLGVSLFGYSDGWRGLLAGVALLMLSMFTPFALFGMIKLGDDAAMGRMAGGGPQVARSAQSASKVVSQVSSRSSRSSGTSKATSSPQAGSAKGAGAGGGGTAAASSGTGAAATAAGPVGAAAGAAMVAKKHVARAGSNALHGVSNLPPPTASAPSPAPRPAPRATRPTTGGKP